MIEKSAHLQETRQETRRKEEKGTGSFYFYFILIYFYLFIYLLILVSQDRVSLCSSGSPGTRPVDQAGFELRNPPASASQGLGLKACATTARPPICFLVMIFV